MPAIDVVNAIQVTNETWAKQGPPLEAWTDVGRLGRAIKKMNDWTGDTTAKLPLATGRTGVVGSNYAEAYANSQGSSYIQYGYPIRALFAVAKFRQLFLAALSSGTATREQIAQFQKELQRTMGSVLYTMSYLVWGDGTGRIAKGDGAYAVAGTTITLKNRKSAYFFEAGDRLVLIDTGAAIPSGGQPTPRAFAVAPNDYLEVLKVDPRLGTLVVDKNVSTAIPTAANTDYIGKAVQFDADYGLLDGVFRTIARTETAATSTVFGVDRSVYPTRMAGSRVLTSINESPYEVIGKMLESATDNCNPDKPGARWTIFTPTGVMKSLVAEMKANGVEYSTTERPADRKVLTMGYTETWAAWPDFGRVAIVADKCLVNPDVTADEDQTYVFMDVNNLGLKMTPDGIGYKKFEDGGGVLKQIPGLLEYYAQNGTYSNLIVDGHHEFIVADPWVNS